jgi:hypothetical protein
VEVRLFRKPTPRWAIRLAAAAFATGVLTATLPAAAQSTPPATVGDVMSARQFVGITAEEGVVVRAGPGVAELPVATLPAGTEVVVIHRRGDFLRILPPEGTFCLVPKARVNIRGEDEGVRTGRVSAAASVRVGSTLNAAVGSTSLRLSPGEEVRVLGEEGIYYKIDPPRMVFFYVPVNQMRKGREVQVAEAGTRWSITDVLPEPLPDADPTTPTTPTTPDTSDTSVTTPPAEPEVAESDADDPALANADLPAEPLVTEPADSLPAPLVVTPPASPLTQAFDTLDARYLEVAELPLEEQPLEMLETEYAELLAGANEAVLTGDPAAGLLVTIIEARLKTIRIRRDALVDLQSIRSMRQDLAERQAVLEAERAELAERAERGRVEVHDAVGQLYASSLQISDGVLFRLCDPETKRTLIYLHASGETVDTLTAKLGGFVAVRGETVTDGSIDLTFIEVAESTRVDPEDVFGSIAAKLVPPSMIPDDTPRQAASD